MKIQGCINFFHFTTLHSLSLPIPNLLRHSAPLDVQHWPPLHHTVPHIGALLTACHPVLCFVRSWVSSFLHCAIFTCLTEFRRFAVANQENTARASLQLKTLVRTMGGVAACEGVEASTLPRALDSLSEICGQIANKRQQVVFFLDYDGTLSPIVADPNAAYIPAATRSVLELLSRRFPTTIVTGRAVPKVKSFLGLDGLMYAGSHGFDIDAPPLAPLSVGSKYLPALAAFKSELTSASTAAPGCAIEDNRFSVSVHYRHVSPSCLPQLRSAVDEAVNKLGLRIHQGKMVWEIRPQFDWHKGKAVMYILKQLGMDNDRYFPIYIGDDVTDEDAFRSLGNEAGVGIVVYDSESAPLGKERPTLAALRLRSPDEVRDLLCRFANDETLVSLQTAPDTNGTPRAPTNNHATAAAAGSAAS